MRSLERARLDQPRELAQVKAALQRSGPTGQLDCVDEIGPGCRHGARIIVMLLPGVKT
jgi:hypothetical protein